MAAESAPAATGSAFAGTVVARDRRRGRQRDFQSYLDMFGSPGRVVV
jgi:hypothetical protein